MLGGGLLGSAARAGVGQVFPYSGGFPVALLSINLGGSFLLGLYLARWERSAPSRWSLQFWAIGGLGSFTTFSAFSLDIVELLRTGRAGTAAGYVVASLVGGLFAALVGQSLGSVTR